VVTEHMYDLHFKALGYVPFVPEQVDAVPSEPDNTPKEPEKTLTEKQSLQEQAKGLGLKFTAKTTVAQLKKLIDDEVSGED